MTNSIRPVETERGRTRGSGSLAVLTLAVMITASACGSGTSHVDLSGAHTGVRHSYSVFFNLASGRASKIQTVVQDGPSLQTALEQAVDSSLSRVATGARVDKVTVFSGLRCTAQHLSSPCAAVTYAVLGPGTAPLYSGQQGYAVYQEGTWLVSKSTVCAFLTLLYKAQARAGSPPGC